jgi:ammonium transporter Rh
MGTCADLLIHPGSAFVIGGIAGWVSVIGYTKIQPLLQRHAGLHDTCGVNNLHGMPSIIGGIAGIIASAVATQQVINRLFQVMSPNNVVSFG